MSATVIGLETQVDVWVRYLDGAGPTPYVAAVVVAVSFVGVCMSYLERAMRRATAS